MNTSKKIDLVRLVLLMSILGLPMLVSAQDWPPLDNSQCFNGVQDVYDPGNDIYRETDVDCGAHCSLFDIRCDVAMTCDVDNDCLSNRCAIGECYACTSGPDDNCNEGVCNPKTGNCEVDGKVAICHKDTKTINVDQEAVLKHIKHGDTVGPCAGDATICHEGKVTLNVGANAVLAHLSHGDTVGACVVAE